MTADTPFPGFLQPGLEPLVAAGSHSGNIFVARDASGKRYKLRAYATEAQAAYIEGNIRKVPHIVPAVRGREGRYLLMDYLEGWRPMLNKELLAEARAVGRMCGEVHALNDPGSHDPQAAFYQGLGAIVVNGSVDARLAERTLAAFDRLTAGLDIRVVLELGDIFGPNFMTDGKNILLVDEESLHHRAKGAGFGKVLKRIKKPGQWEEFLAGYREHADAAYLTADYLQYILLVETVRSIEFKTTHQRYLDKVPGELEALRQLAR
jgi:hypothetical protein